MYALGFAFVDQYRSPLSASHIGQLAWTVPKSVVVVSRKLPRTGLNVMLYHP